MTTETIPRYLRSCRDCILCIDDDELGPYCLENYLSKEDVWAKYAVEKQIQCIRNLTSAEYETMTDKMSINESQNTYDKMLDEIKRDIREFRKKGEST